MSKEHCEREGSCIFCDIVKGKAPQDLITESERSIAIISLEGNPLVLPKKHVDAANISESIEDMMDVYRLANQIEPFVKDVYEVSAVNLLENRGKDSGQEICHYHMHIIPRHQKDKAVIIRHTQMDPEYRKKRAESLRKSIGFSST